MYQGIYELIGSEMSFFSRKLEAQLRFQHIPWRWQFKTEQRKAVLEARAGTHFVPLLLTPDKWLIHDTITIGPLLSDRFRDRAVIPETPLQRSCCFILEDAFNHWLGRVCVHSRWCYPDNVAWVGLRFGANMMMNRSIDEPLSDSEQEQLAPIGPKMYKDFGKNVCEVNGVGPDQTTAVQTDFKNMLGALALHFATNDFLLGDTDHASPTSPLPGPARLTLSVIRSRKAGWVSIATCCIPTQSASSATGKRSLRLGRQMIGYQIPCRLCWTTCRVAITSRHQPILPPALLVKRTTSITVALALFAFAPKSV
jgi:glutathione S-transferase